MLAHSRSSSSSNGCWLCSISTNELWLGGAWHVRSTASALAGCVRQPSTSSLSPRKWSISYTRMRKSRKGKLERGIAIWMKTKRRWIKVPWMWKKTGKRLEHNQRSRKNN